MTSLLVIAAVVVVGACLGDRHVHRLDQRPGRVQRVLLGGDPVEPADVPRQQAVARGIEDAHRPQADAGRDTHDADAVVERTDDPGDVRAVAVGVAPRVRVVRGAADAADHVEVDVGLVDAGVDDGDVGVDPLARGHVAVRAVDPRDVALGGGHPSDAGRLELAGHRDDLVGHHVLDVGVGPQRRELAGVEVRRVAFQRVAERPIGLDAEPGRLALGRVDVLAILERDDVAAVRRQLRLRLCRVLAQHREAVVGRRSGGHGKGGEGAHHDGEQAGEGQEPGATHRPSVSRVRHGGKSRPACAITRPQVDGPVDGTSIAQWSRVAPPAYRGGAPHADGRGSALVSERRCSRPGAPTRPRRPAPGSRPASCPARPTPAS